MKIQDIISKIEKLENELTKAMDERKEQNVRIYTDTEKDAKAYFDDVEKKEHKIKERVSTLEAKKKEVSASINSLKPQLVSATASGNEAEFKNIQKQLAEMKANELAIAEQINMLETAEINGEESLYKAVSENHDKLLDDSGALSELWDKINNFSDKQKDFWESIEQKTKSFIGPLCLTVNPGKESKTAQQVENHYNKKGDVINSNETERIPDARNIETFRRGSYE